MATTFRFSGDEVPVQTASGAIASGALCSQEGFIGIAKTAMASGGSGWLKTTGVHIIPVPAGVVKGDSLYYTATASPLTESVAITLTETAAGGVPVGKAVGDRDADGKALVKLCDLHGLVVS